MKILATPLITLLLALLAASGAGAGVLSLNPALPDTLDADLLQRLGLFPDQPHAVAVHFEQAAWGGVVAHLKVQRDFRVTRLERTLSHSGWLAMQDRAALLVAGQELGPWDELTAADLEALRQKDKNIQAWPEVPARNRKLPAQVAAETGPQYPSVGGQWLVQGGLGYQHNISSYGDYFGDMGVFHLGFARALNNHFWPCVEFTAGFGNLRSDYEDQVGDGRGSNYSVMGGLLYNTSLGQKTKIYLGGLGGYYRRSLQWGDLYRDPETGDEYLGHAQESGGWGYSLQLGLMFQKSHHRKARFFDLGLGLMRGLAADDDLPGVDDDDTWLMLTFRFWDQI